MPAYLEPVPSSRRSGVRDAMKLEVVSLRSTVAANGPLRRGHEPRLPARQRAARARQRHAQRKPGRQHPCPALQSKLVKRREYTTDTDSKQG